MTSARQQIIDSVHTSDITAVEGETCDGSNLTDPPCQMITQTREDRIDVAHHECAHAVAFEVMASGVQTVSIAPDETGPGCCTPVECFRSPQTRAVEFACDYKEILEYAAAYGLSVG